MTDRLPIEDVLPELCGALPAHGSAVLQAPPGAGKTTRVPLAVLDEPWLDGRRIVMLEPRRLAARAAARRMARLLGESVGQTVGYRVRMDTRVGSRTRIEVVTEGVLTRLLQDDPALEGVGIVVFDEFHERNLHADLGLALCLQARTILRPDLKVLVMSATLDAEPVAALLAGAESAGSAAHAESAGAATHAAPAGGAPVITGGGRQHPVETHYRDRRVDGHIEPAVVRTVRRALDETDDGDVLVFLPGAREIRRVERYLADDGLPAGVRVAPLFGNLPQDAQDRAIEPSPPGERKVVLATSIAETSLTIEGVRVVVDSGVMRVPRFSPRTGMSRLETVRVTRASADQRRGRAGRLGPGVCYRLWTEATQRRLVPYRRAEILEADLAPLALELAAWGTPDPAELRWLDPPPAGAFAQATDLLRQLGALDDDGAITDHGRRMAQLGVHPRLAHMMLRARSLGLGGLGCELAALLSGRDILRGLGGPPPADLRLRVEALRGDGAGRSRRIRRGARRRALREVRHWRRRLDGSDGDGDPGDAGLLLAFAYPDRIARRRSGRTGRYLLRNGRGAALMEMEALVNAEWIVAAELDDRGAESRIRLAAPLDESAVERHFGDQMEIEAHIGWDAEAEAVRCRQIERLGALVLRDAPLPDPDPDAVADALLGWIRGEGLDALPWTRRARRLRQRMTFMPRIDPGWPDVSEETLVATLDDWLRPYVYGMTRRSDLDRLNLSAILRGMLSHEHLKALDAWAPTHFVVPSGSRIPIDYGDPDSPVLAVRLQELFGLEETPRIGRGSVPLTLHLLSPAHRPVQVTQDLASFWRHAYFEVKKDLKGRYPKHYWPEDPLDATPTRRTRPNR